VLQNASKWVIGNVDHETVNLSWVKLNVAELLYKYKNMIKENERKTY
jgi:hypothetical protein